MDDLSYPKVKSEREFFDETGIRPVKITDWLDWACCKSGRDDEYHIVLPMIQRGSVWRPDQVMDLWDTLLRGMPMGSMMASIVEEEAEYFLPIDRQAVVVKPGNAISLLDGQQRTLSMLLAWPPVGSSMGRRIWIDMAEDSETDHLFRYLFSTLNHPFGFDVARGGPVGKLSLDKRRRALALHEIIHGLPIATKERKVALWEKARPWEGYLPIDLRLLLQIAQNDDISAFRSFVEGERQQLLRDLEVALGHPRMPEGPFRRMVQDWANNLGQIASISSRAGLLFDALRQMHKKYMPVIEVPATSVDGKEAGSDDEKSPVLAVLFQRIGTRGTPLSNADYVYSVLKYRNHRCHGLVEDILTNNERASALFTPVSLVSSAVRLTAAVLPEIHQDYVKIEKGQFSKLMRVPKFLEEFNRNIEGNGPFRVALEKLLQAIKYEDKGDIGFPKHALCLIEVPILEIMLLWVMRQGEAVEITRENRHRLVRFALYCALAVPDFAKASAALFKLVKGLENVTDFPEEEIIRALTDDDAGRMEPLALPVRSPRYYREQLTDTVSTVDLSVGLRGDEDRFGAENDSREVRRAKALYRRFWNRRWNHRHEMLLWIQRDYVFRQFEESPALPGAEEETPFDYDHICPQSHWYDLRSVNIGQHLRNPHQRGHVAIGNAIGNLRIWDSSDNRGDGDSAPSIKLGLEGNMLEDESKGILACSAIENPEDWKTCSGSPDSRWQWGRERATAFQLAVERRTFRLYERFYDELRLSDYEAWNMCSKAN